MMNKGFDNQLYLNKQSQNISQRIGKFSKLYLEFGGKLFDDMHAARVLPGFDENVKISLLKTLKDKVEVIVCISAKHIMRNKIRADFGIAYSAEALRLIDGLRSEGIYVSAIVITMYEKNDVVEQFRQNLLNRKENVYIHRPTKGYPKDVEIIVSEDGYGKNCFIPTTRPLVVVTAPGPGSGKLATCLSQLYHEHRTGNSAGYAKFETFPIWNLPLNHPLNVAYEAATADLHDVNMIDYYHLQTYGETAVNYNRDLESFPLLTNILKRITGQELYHSPTDMGVNMLKHGIVDDNACCLASTQEVIRRYYTAKVECKMGRCDGSIIEHLELLMTTLGVNALDRPCVLPALTKQEQCGLPVCSIQLLDGTVVTGKQSSLLTSSSAALLNALKYLAKIDDSVKLLPEQVIEPIRTLNRNIYKSKREMMTLEQVLVALSVSQPYDKNAILAIEQLPHLKHCQAHTTRIPSKATQSVFRRLGIQLTSQDVYISDDLYTD